MKLKQSLIIKQYFIDYSLGVYSKDLKPTVSGNFVRILEQNDYENVLDITKLVTKDDGDIGVIFESPDLFTEEQVYTLNVVNNQFIFNSEYIEANSYPSVEDIPMETNNALVAIDKDGKKDLVLLVDPEFAKLSEEEQKTALLDIFKQQVRIDFDTPEVIGGVKFDLNDSVWKAKDNKLNIHSAVIKGDIEVYNDDRGYYLIDTHIGKLGLTDKKDPYTHLRLRTTDGEKLSLDLTDHVEVQKWIDGKIISITGSASKRNQQIKITSEEVEEVISYGGPHVHLSETEITDITGYQLGTPNLIKIPDYLPEWVTNMRNFLTKASSFNSPINLDTSKVTDMKGFLRDASSFNQPLELDTSNVTNMFGFLWGASSFNQPLNLDTSNVTDMKGFLNKATSFNQDLSHLCVPLIKSLPNDFASGATAYKKPRPIWGTCPSRE